MAAFLPTCRADVLRGSATDGYGDQADTGTVAAYGVAVSIVEVTRVDRPSASGTPRTIRRCRARLRPGADIRTGDRLMLRSGVTFVVAGVTTPVNVVGAADVICDLVRVTG